MVMSLSLAAWSQAPGRDFGGNRFDGGKFYANSILGATLQVAGGASVQFRGGGHFLG
jgi:hypothetical protein